MFHQTIVIGRLGRDPVERTTKGGTLSANFSVACNRKFQAGEELRTETIWYTVTAWGKTAQAVIDYLHKGSAVMCVGRLHGSDKGNPRIWVGDDGVSRASFELNAQTVRFLDKAPTSDAPNCPPLEDDDIVF